MLVLIAGFALAAAAPASAQNGQSVVASDGWLAHGQVGGFTDLRGGTYRFQAVLMVPQGAVEGSGPQQSGEPDVRRPWVSLTESSKDAFGGNHTECSTLENVSPASYANVRVGEVPEFHVDVACEDGRGYDFYRLRWQGTEPLDFGSATSTVPLYRQTWWGPSYVFDRPHYGGTAEWATFRSDGRSSAKLSVCGYRGAEADCMAPEGRPAPWGGALVEGGWASIKVTATRSEYSSCC